MARLMPSLYKSEGLDQLFEEMRHKAFAAYVIFELCEEALVRGDFTQDERYVSFKISERQIRKFCHFNDKTLNIFCQNFGKFLNIFCQKSDKFLNISIGKHLILYDGAEFPQREKSIYINNNINNNNSNKRIKNKYAPNRIEETQRNEFDFDAIYEIYPRRRGKREGYKIFCSEIKTAHDYEQLTRAIKNYSSTTIDTDPKFIKYFSSFMRNWRDYLTVELPARGGHGKSDYYENLRDENPFRKSSTESMNGSQGNDLRPIDGLCAAVGRETHEGQA